jgi:flagellar hook-associated protein 1 FlgK
MSLSNAASIAQSALNTVTAQTAVVSRNIAGANSTGTYNDKTANVVSTPYGSQVISVTRAQNQALFDNVLSSTSASAMQNAISSGLDTLQETVGDTSSTQSPSALLSSFTNALTEYQSSPSDTTTADSVVTAAQALTSGLNSASSTVQQVREQADSQMSASVTTINSLLSQFQTVNNEVVSGTAAGTDVTDLLDSRDSILTQLSQQIGVTTVTGTNNDMSIYTDSGVTLFQGTARSVTFQPTSTYAAGTTGNAVYIDGVPVTGSSATMPLQSGTLAGLASLRDTVTVQYQSQLDQIANGLITTFAESPQDGSGSPTLPGLFTTSGATSMPSSTTGLASAITVNPNVDPSQGGNVNLLRDGGISSPGSSTYTYNTTGDASYTGRISQLLSGLSATTTFSTAGGIDPSDDLSGYAAASESWLEAQRSNVSSESTYQSTLLSTATSALTNATGVSLDNEMSKMLDLENSYGSSAKLMTTIDGMFSSLMTDLQNITS